MHTATNPLSRRVFFWSLVFSDITLTILIVFLAMGYRFSFERGIFIYTGSTTVKSNPADGITISTDNAVVGSLRNFINGSYNQTGIPPGFHDVHVTANGFKPWKKNARFSSGYATEFWNVLLVREDYERTAIGETTVEEFYLSPDASRVATLTTIGTPGTPALTVRTFALDPTNTAITPTETTLPQATLTEQPYINTEWSHEMTALAVPAVSYTTGTAQEVYYVITGLADTAPTNVEVLFDVKHVRWHPGRTDTLYYIRGNTLYYRAARDAAGTASALLPTPVEVLIAEDVLAYDTADDGLYILRHDGTILYDRNHDGQGLSVLTKMAGTYAPDTAARVIAFQNDRLAVLNDTTTSISVYNHVDQESVYNHTLLTEGATGASFSDDGKKLLFYTDTALFVHFLRDEERQPARSADTTHTVKHFDAPIDNIHWARTYEHILFATPSGLALIELDHRGDRNQTLITPLSTEHSRVVSDFGGYYLYFLDAAAEDLSSESTGTTLQRISFPEKDGLFN